MGRQHCLRPTANFIQSNSAKIAVGLSLILIVLCVAIKSAKLDPELSSWIQRSSRIDSELNYINGAIGETSGSTSQLLIQTPHKDDFDNILTVDALMVHLEALAIATHVTIDLYDVTWSLKELCYTPTLPDFDLPITQVLERIMPCVIKTPLDCFWEASKLLGPEQPISYTPAGMFNSKWTSLNPLAMIEQLQHSSPHASVPYNTIIAWMRRVGITTGYQHKPCLDPTDPNCPLSAPNKFTREQPDVAHYLTGGCRGFAANQMHWHEEEIVGGVRRNKSTGEIMQAAGLQSTIQLMGEQDMYDFWRKTSKVQDINNWSTDKAKFVLDTWQERFKQELDQFTRTSRASSSYKIHAMTSKSMLEPIDISTLLNLTNFVVCFIIMTIISCILFPEFKYQIDLDKSNSIPPESSPSSEIFSKHFDRIKIIYLALLTSSFVGLTFISSLGLSSFINLPFNMATTQILPPLALLFAFNQVTTVVNIYSQKLEVNWSDLTFSSLDELLPIITIESISYIIALLVATIIPVQGMRIFIFQAVTFISLATLVSLLLIPAVIVTFIKYQIPSEYLLGNDAAMAPESSHSTVEKRSRLRIGSPSRFFLHGNKTKSHKQTIKDESAFEKQMFSTLVYDLKNIQANKNDRPTTVINFSANLSEDCLHASFNLTKSRNFQSNYCDNFSIQASNLVPPARLNPISESSNPPSYEFSQLSANQSTTNDISQKNSHNVDSELGNSSNLKQKEAVTDNERPGRWYRLFQIYINSIINNKLCQLAIGISSLILCLAMLFYAPKVNYGLHLRDIVAQGTVEYESFSMQEKYFPVYNIFAITKGNFDYPNNQKLLHEFHKSIQQVDGVIEDKEATKPKFWLVAFRDWLVEIQNKFDVEKEKSAISVEGWTQDTGDEAKLAYKLLAQTGKVENPVDKSLVEFNRLVDKDGIINPKAFYYYLAAWVMNDAFTYATSEANFRPEPKVWNDNPDDLKVERARPLTYTQIPFLMRLPGNRDSLKTITQIRSISQAFEQLNLPNFPTGIPFVFWDQFFNLDLLVLIAVAIGTITTFTVIGVSKSDFISAAIITLPVFLTILEVYSLMGFVPIAFNNILAVLIIIAIGLTTVQTIQFSLVSINHKSSLLSPHYRRSYFNSDSFSNQLQCFQSRQGDNSARLRYTIENRFRMVFTNLILSFICVIVFYLSKVELLKK